MRRWSRQIFQNSLRCEFGDTGDEFNLLVGETGHGKKRTDFDDSGQGQDCFPFSIGEGMVGLVLMGKVIHVSLQLLHEDTTGVK